MQFCVGSTVQSDEFFLAVLHGASRAIERRGLTPVRASPLNLGMLAARLVLGLRDGEVEGPVKEVLPPQLVVRSSCAPARQRQGGHG